MRIILISGAVAGLIHVLSGPDHLTAVAPLAMSDGRRGWLTGWTWGLGHTSGIVCLAALALMLRDWLPPIDTLSAWGERLVGVALMGVGAWALRRSASINSHAHRHGRRVHRHLHVRRGPAWFTRLGHAHASFYMGILHGVAGSSHFFGVLPALALPSSAAGLTYVAAFGIGSVLAMTAFAATMGLASERLGRAALPQRGMMRVSGLAALSVGAFWLLR
ncbi:MAG: High-affinity nickel transporter [Vicinamibacterales bacterium]